MSDFVIPMHAPADTVSIVTQTRIVPGRESEFAAWQETVNAAIAQQSGFLDQKVMPPRPPAQVDWVILQRFANTASAQQWMRSETRMKLLDTAQPFLAGSDDVHLIQDGDLGVLPSPASVVISTRIKPGQEMAYRAWERRMAGVQAKAPGFQGYRTEAPVPGVQENWVSIVRFDSDAHLAQWMKSSERLRMVNEGKYLSLDFHARVVRTGFDQWFAGSTRSGGPSAPAWKQNMLVLLMLYPVVFLFGLLVQGPLLIRAMAIPFWLALFIGNVVGVILLNYLVPWVCTRFGWWLRPTAHEDISDINRKGMAIVVALYVILLAMFSRLG